MKKAILILLVLFWASASQSQTVEMVYSFDRPIMTEMGSFHTVNFSNTQLSGLPGEPMLPYHSVSLLLPPGTAAESIEIIGEMETTIEGTYTLFPQQHVRPVSEGRSGTFLQKEEVYNQAGPYPTGRSGHLTTQYLNGYSVALSSFTPVTYHPASGTISFFRKVTVKITAAIHPEAEKSLDNYTQSPASYARLVSLAQNPVMAESYPLKTPLKSNYQILIITSDNFSSSFQSLIGLYQGKGMSSQVVTTQTIGSTMTGQDLQEKIRNFIIQEYQANGVEYVLLGGDVEIIPYRGFYCQVQSSSIYEDANIPADLYYSALDGNWNTNGNNLWGEPGEDDLLPDVAVTRFPFSTETELQNMIHKSISYQESPVFGELQQPLLVGEHLWDNPMTFGGDFMDLLIDDQTANGYFTHGIPSADNTIGTLYDTLISLPGNIFLWEPITLINEINMGKSFIHHLGHSSEMYMMRLYIWDITNQNFSDVNGVDHNYTLLYTQGCLSGAFDSDDCIGEKSVTIENFLAAGVFNSRYGWFNEGQTEGPSQHLNREFVSALYHDTTAYQRIGETQMMSKIKTAPWVTAPGQWEPGALRWCFYACNVFGDPAMKIWTDDPTVGFAESSGQASLQLHPNPAADQTTLTVEGPLPAGAEVILSNTLGQEVLRSPITASKLETHNLRIDLTGVNPGYYIVSLKSTSGVKSIKLIVTN